MTVKTDLATRISGTVLAPGDDGYDETIKRWAENSEKKAEVIVLPESAEDISKTIIWVNDNNVDIAIKGGGHSASGASSSNGLVIDLSRLRNVRVDPEKRLAYAQGGALWSDFNTATTAHGFVSPGGVVSHTGVGGLVVGGGQGYLTGQYGLCIDNLQEVTVVVANGDIVKASESENPDLFWGIRGGGSNFGVVYEFVLRLHPHSGTVFGGFMAFTVDKVPQIVAAYKKLEPFRPDMAIWLGVGAPEKTTFVLVVPFLDTTDLATAKEFYADFYALEPVMDITAVRPYVELNTILDAMMCHGPRTYMTGFDYQTVPPELLEHTVDKFTHFVSKVGDDYRGSVILYESYPYGKVVQQSNDATAYANRGTHFNCTVCLRWMGADHDEWIKQYIKDFVRDAREIEKSELLKEGRKPTAEKGYANFHLPAEPAEKAFYDHLPRLIELKQKWDPKGIFNKWFSIPTSKQ